MLTKFHISKKNIRKLKGKSLSVDYDGVPGGIRTHDPLLRRQSLDLSFEMMASHS